VDPITHVLLGAGVSYAAFGRKLGRHAAGIGALAGLAPDADVFIRSQTDPLLAIELHRHFTHSLFFAVLGALVVTSPWLAFQRFRPKWKTLWLCALLGYWSHCLLDASTSYGTQVLWPFSNHRFGWDLVSIIDPLVTLVMLVGLTVSLIRRTSRPVAISLVVFAAYLMFGGIQNQRALRAQSLLAQQRGHAVEHAAAMPTIGNNLIWRSLYLHDGRIYSDRIRAGWFSRPTVREGTSLPVITLADLTETERQRNAGRRFFERFAWFSDDWVARSPFDETVIADARYSLSTEAFDPIWGIRFTPPDEPVAAEWVSRTRERKVEPGKLWAEVIGRDREYRPIVK
jgi:inner membrane protein